MTSLKQFWANKNYRTSAIIALALCLWLASGMFAEPKETEPPQKNAEVQPAQETKARTEVRARHIQAQEYPLIVSATAQTEANRFVNLRAEVGGQVDKLPVAEGSQVNAGDVICRLAVEDRAQRLEEARASVAQAQIDYDGAQRLASDGLQSRTAIASAKARLESAKANLLRREIDLEKTEIRAPFTGIVEDRPVEIGDLIRPGDTCATVIDLNPLVVSAQVSEKEVGRITKGSTVKVQLVSGERRQGTVRFIARRADEVTRTFRVEAVVDNPEMKMAGGITADMSIEVGTVPAHLISSSLLTLDSTGELGVRVLDQDKRVEFYNVELIGDAGDGVWVTGLPQSTLLITVGHQYVGIGEQVAVSLEENAAAAVSAMR
ncbi:efflux RND transporter periplasmic adaptor subunit [Gilvimarinus sp. F26214L]|uniref:efflux RND transporter periplasmic adaptor subunit n=1 Tax=Gilvimarinus sp. DZF01 TaxID=3461371 RepID=UPI004045E57F